MKKITLFLPEQSDSDSELVLTIEKQYGANSPPPRVTSNPPTTQDQGANTRSGSTKRSFQYPLTEKPPKKRNPIRSQTEILDKLEEINEQKKQINEQNKQIKMTQETISDKLDRLTTLMMDYQTRMDVAETGIRDLQEARRDATAPPSHQPSTSRAVETTPHEATPHATTGTGTGTYVSRGLGMF